MLASYSLATPSGSCTPTLATLGAMSRVPPRVSQRFRYLCPVVALLSVAALGKQDPQARLVAEAPSLAGPGAAAAAQQPDAKSLFAQLCAACHGPAGAGDGPTASYLKPKPVSFADTAFQAARTDQQLAAVITRGKPPMPAYGQRLSPAQVTSLVAYIRQLGK